MRGADPHHLLTKNKKDGCRHVAKVFWKHKGVFHYEFSFCGRKHRHTTSCGKTLQFKQSDLHNYEAMIYGNDDGTDFITYLTTYIFRVVETMSTQINLRKLITK